MVLAHHQEAVGAGARHDAIEQARSDRRSGRAVEILIERQRLAKQSERVRERAFCALRDAELAVILAASRRRRACNNRSGARSCHSGHPSRKDRSASRAKWLKFAVIRRKLSTWFVSPAMQATISASPASTARAARRNCTMAEAPPIGTCSRKRGDSPTCWVKPTAVSGASVKLETARPSISLLADAGRPDQLRQGSREKPMRAHGSSSADRGR